MLSDDELADIRQAAAVRVMNEQEDRTGFGFAGSPEALRAGLRAVAEAAVVQALEDAADAIYHKQHPESVRQMLRARAASISTDKAGVGE